MIRRSTAIRVRYPDTDQMGVVYHGVYLEYFETGRTELLRDLGMAYSSIEATGVLLPVLEASMKLLWPARYDEVVTVVTTIDSAVTARLRIDYEIYNGDRLLVTGHTLHAFTRREDMRPVRPPREFVELIERSREGGAGSGERGAGGGERGVGSRVRRVDR